MKSRRLRPFVFVLLCGCGAAATTQETDVVTPPPPPSAPSGPPVFTVSNTKPWAGSTVSISSASFLNHAGLPTTVQFGALSSALTRMNDTVYTTIVPSTLTGTLSPVIQVGSDSYSLPAITIAGYEETFTFPLHTGWSFLPWFPGGRTLVLANTNDQGTPNATGLTIFDLDARTLVTYPSLAKYAEGEGSSLEGPAPTLDDSVFAVQTPSGSVETWRLLPTPVRVASHPELPQTLTMSLMQLGSDMWFVGQKNASMTRTGANGNGSWTPGVVSSDLQRGYSVRLSPTHDRAAVVWGHIANGAGVTVYAAPSGQAAFVIPDLLSSFSVDFSRDGKQLAITGETVASSKYAVRVYDAVSGALRADTTITECVVAVAFDPYRPNVYVGLYDQVLVLDRANLRLVGRMKMPSHLAILFPGAMSIVPAIDGSVYYVSNENGGNIRVFRFSSPK